MADRTPRRPTRDRYERERNFDHQAEQFEGDYGQMGENSWRDDELAQGRTRDFSRDRNYGRAPDFARDDSPGYPAGRGGPNRYERESSGFASFTGNDYGGSDFSAPRYTGSGSYGGSYGGYGAGSRLAHARGEWHDEPRASFHSDYRSDYRDRDQRGWFERAGDEVASWFGDEDAARRREADYTGHGPSGYKRSDSRIIEDASDELTDDWGVDARNIKVTVKDGELTLDGTVPSRDQKRRAEDCVEDISGVKHVQNNLRVAEQNAWNRNNDGDPTTTV